MSTRCQVKVVGSETIDSNDVQMLYHHTDGYPSYMIKVLQKALKIALKSSATVKYAQYTHGKREYNVAALPWEAGRVGKAASAMCAADPLVMEPDANELHSDIQYLYRIYLVNPSGLGHTGERVRWDFDVCVPRANFWDEPTEANMVVVVPRQPLHKASGKKIEKALRG